jgi:spore coat protein U-like protein
VATTVAVRVAVAGTASRPEDADRRPVDRNRSAVSGCRIDVEPIVIVTPVTSVEATEGENGVMNGTAAITLHCSPGTAYEVAAGRGRNYDGGRRMQDDATAAYIRYELFLDPGHTVPWEEDRPLRGVAGADASAHITVYARFHAEELAPHAHYADAIDVRVDYY